MDTVNPREVLSYLNELGYHNISAIQLKEFMKDLKKLMKYENRQKEQRHANVENVQPPPTNVPSSMSSLLAPTLASTAKQVRPKENMVSVQIKRSSRNCYSDCGKRPAPFCHPDCVKYNANELATSSDVLSGNTTGPDNPNTASNPTSCISSCTKRSKSCDNKKCKVSFKGSTILPKASYIIPHNPVKTQKSDPVALYHWYQQEWKKQKLPGEDNHSELRWAIREQMLGGRQILSTAPSMEVIARKRKTSQRI